MIIDSVDVTGLGDNAEEAFVVFEERLRAVLLPAQIADRTEHLYHGEYSGSFAPQRHYVSSIMAFLDEYELEIGDVTDISKVSNVEFQSKFNDFFGSINYARTRFKLRKEKIDAGQVGTPIVINTDYKEQIYKNLDTIRKIVNSNVADPNKKDVIYNKIASLQSEIDRDRTTLDAIFGRFLQLSKVLGDSAENLEPAIQKLERVMNAIRDGSKPVARLTTKEKPKLLTSSEKTTELLDDEIPF